MTTPEADQFHPPFKVDYARAPEASSVWGAPNTHTQELCRAHFQGGIILEPAAGDSRYGIDILAYAEYLVANDVSREALAQLRHRASTELRHKLREDIYEIPGRLPYADGTFDGVLNTGFLYLYPPQTVEEMIQEVQRVLKPGGTLILEFLTDRQRTETGTNRPIEGDSENAYTEDEGRRMLERLLGTLFNNFSLETATVDSHIHVPLIGQDDIDYHLTGSLIIAAAHK